MEDKEERIQKNIEVLRRLSSGENVWHNVNFSKEFGDLRDIWFSTHEAEFAAELLTKREYRDFVDEIQSCPHSYKLYEKALELMAKIENGECKNEEEAELCEAKISACLMRADAAKVLEENNPDYTETHKNTDYDVDFGMDR